MLSDSLIFATSDGSAAKTLPNETLSTSSTCDSVTAVTVADRAAPVISDISPKKSPGPRWPMPRQGSPMPLLKWWGSYERRKPATEKPRSEALPAHLPRYEVKLITPQEMPDFDPGDPKSARAREVIAAALEPRRASVTARMWAYKSVTASINLFDFTVSRHRHGPEIVLSGFEGTILADCYAGYESIELGSAGKIRRAACVAHARRKVFESRNNHPAHAALLLGLFQRLYDIEDRAKSFTPDDRRSLRQSESLPIWDEIGVSLASDAVANVMPKEPFGQAITYLRNNIEALRVHLDDGLVPIDNNDTEQLMKQVALGRKNWMFIGSIDAGNRAADLMTLVSSAVQNDLDVFLYLKDVLDKLLGGSRDFEAMRPDVWKLAHPEAVRIYRQDERRHRAEVKSAKRAKRRAALCGQPDPRLSCRDRRLDGLRGFDPCGADGGGSLCDVSPLSGLLAVVCDPVARSGRPVDGADGHHDRRIPALVPMAARLCDSRHRGGGCRVASRVLGWFCQGAGRRHGHRVHDRFRGAIARMATAATGLSRSTSLARRDHGRWGRLRV